MLLAMCVGILGLLMKISILSRLGSIETLYIYSSHRFSKADGQSVSAAWLTDWIR